jgi:cytochrome c-type biogenesis protein CcmH
VTPRGAITLAAALMLVVFALLVAATRAPAVDLDGRTLALARELRCPVCGGTSVADSPSMVAADMRSAIRAQLAEGRSPDEVKAWFAERYGEDTILTPRNAASGWAIRLVPFAAVAVAATVAWRALAPRRARAEP